MFVKMISAKDMKKYFEKHWTKTDSGYERYKNNGVCFTYLYEQLYPLAEKEIHIKKITGHPLFFYIGEGVGIPSNELFNNIENNGAGI